MGRQVYNIGFTKGLLTIESIDRVNYTCVCKCACGNIVDLPLTVFTGRRPKIKSCGCLFPKRSELKIYNNEIFKPFIKTDRIMALMGKTYGRLTIIDILGKRTGNSIYCVALCTCGKEKVINTDAVVTGLTTSCGCYSKEVCANRWAVERDGLKGATTANTFFSYTIYDEKYKKWTITCNNCGKLQASVNKYEAEKLLCSCRRRGIDRLSLLVGTTINWITVDELIVPEKGITAFKCHCMCGKIEIYPAYYIENKRVACCKNCTLRYKSLQYGGTGVPGETRGLSAYLRDNDLAGKWSSKIYQQYRSVCAISNISFNNIKNSLEIHHLNALTNIINANNISIINYQEVMQSDLQNIKTLFYNIDNGILLKKELHRLLHKELGKAPTKEQSLTWINAKRAENNLSPLLWNDSLQQYIG